MIGAAIRRQRVSRAPLLLLALLCIDCGGGGDGDGDGPTPLQNLACEVGDDAARCDSEAVLTLGAPDDLREIYWNAPEGGDGSPLPAVLLYQGSGADPRLSWNVQLTPDTPYGGYYQVALVSALIDAGFVVIQPEARNGLVWTTNGGADYDASSDARLVEALLEALLEALEAGSFGPIELQRLYAVGISSGGYMASRMAVSHPGRFAALAIQSASYATCLGPLCNVPSQLPEDHPPTLFLHGGADTTVPIATAHSYHDALVDAGVDSDFIEAPELGHTWLPEAPEAVTAWFQQHP